MPLVFVLIIKFLILVFNVLNYKLKFLDLLFIFRNQLFNPLYKLKITKYYLSSYSILYIFS